jgi:hypothetical protein
MYTLFLIKNPVTVYPYVGNTSLEMQLWDPTSIALVYTYDKKEVDCVSFGVLKY